MIIGNGLIGSSFKDDENYIIFASGVSNSNSNNINDFKREKELIINTINNNENLKFIYFSSILVEVCDNAYYNHKLEMELLVKELSNDYLIFRIPQIIGKIGNKSNLINHLKNKILEGETVTVFENIDRALVDIDDLVRIVDYCKDITTCDLIKLSSIEKISVLDLVKLIGLSLDKEVFIEINKNKESINWDVDNSDIINETLNKLGIESKNYTSKIITKYIN